MPELDEGSLSIGELRAEMRESRRQREALFEKVDDIAIRLSGLSAQVEHLTQQIEPLAREAARVPRLAEELRGLAPAVEQYRAERIGRRYVVWFVGLACTGLGTVAPIAAEAVKAFLRLTPNP
jgi:hypothetical protein